MSGTAKKAALAERMEPRHMDSVTVDISPGELILYRESTSNFFALALSNVCRARRGASGALHLQSARAGSNSRVRFVRLDAAI